MKILIIGELYSTNLGDGIICENVKYLLEKNDLKKENKIYLVDISCRKGYIKEDTNSRIKKSFIKELLHKNEYLVYKLYNLKRKNYIKNVCNKDYDIAIFAGGHMFMSCFILQLYDFVKYLSKKKTKIIFNACGVGEITNHLLINKIRKMLNNKNVIYISSRDDIDKLKNIYLKNSNIEVSKVYDSAIYTSETYSITKKKDSNIIGLGIMNVSKIGKDKIIYFWKEIIKELNRKNCKWQMFCNGSTEDYDLISECLDAMGINDENKKQYIAKRPVYPKELVETISNYNSIISFRLHSHIVAYSLNIPTIAIIWDEKLRFFFKDLQLEDRCFKVEQKANVIVQKLFEIKNTSYNNDIMEKQKKIINDSIIKYIS